MIATNFIKVYRNPSIRCLRLYQTKPINRISTCLKSTLSFSPNLTVSTEPSFAYNNLKSYSISSHIKPYSTMPNKSVDSIVLGYYEDLSLSSSSSFVDASLVEKLTSLLKVSSAKGKLGESKLFHFAEGPIQRVALVSFGPKIENKTVFADRVRNAIGAGVRQLKANGATHIGVDTITGKHTASEAAALGVYNYKAHQKVHAKSADVNEEVTFEPLGKDGQVEELSTGYDWTTGEIFANAQNLARFWMDSPANLATPTIISEHIKKLGSGIKNLEIIVRDEAWIKEQKMGAFLSVSKGSIEEPKIVEFHYNGGNKDDKPLSFVGKGITFDSGGISIKPSSNMHAMKGDMGGAATVAASVLAIAQLGLPINIRAAIALAENLPSGNATKPGDVVTAINGKTIEVLNTDAEGRMVLSDTLYHVNSTYKPHTVFTVATLTGAIVVALGDPYTGAYASRHSLWEELQTASHTSGDLFWRMPLHPYYKSLMTGSNVADLQNIGSKNGGGSCSAAAFLREFVHLDKEVKEPQDWNDDDTLPTRYGHLDIAAVMETGGDSGYHIKGMSGRPTRTLIEYARLISSKKF